MIAPSSNATHPAAAVAEETTTLRDIWTTVSRNRRLVAGVLLATLAFGALLTLLMPPVYRASTLLRVHSPEGGIGLVSAITPVGGGDGMIETEIAVLRSRRIAEAVVDSLALHVQLTTPERPRDEVLRVVSASRDALEATWELEREEGSDVYRVRRVEAKDGAPPAPGSFAVAAGAPFTIGGVTLELVHARRMPATIRIEVEDFRRTVTRLRDDLSVSRPDRLAQIIEVGYHSSDPVLTAAAANVAATSFIAYKAGASRVESGSTVAFLQQQVADYDTQLRAAEAELRSFRERERVVSPEEEATEQVRRLAALRAQRDELLYERDALAALLARLDATSDTATSTSPYRQLASFPVFLGNRAVQDLLQSITTLENERAELMVRRTESSVDVQGINRRIAEMERQLYQTAVSYLRSLESQLASVDESLGRFGQQLAAVPAREVQFARLLRQQDLLSEMYVLLQTRLKEAEIRNASEYADVRIVDPAIEPDEPVSPKPFRNMLIALVLGSMLGLAAAYARQALDTKVRTAEDAQAATGLPVLALIPRIEGAEAANGGRLPFRRARRDVPQHLNGSRLVARNDPRSPVAEAYRSLRTSIAFASTAGMPRSLVVTSPTPGEGKSTSAANLAVTLAQQGSRALLIDADLRRGLLHEVFGVAQDPGLSHLLLGHATAERAIRRMPLDGAAGELHFLPAGVFPPNPAEMIGSPRMRELLKELTDRFDIVLLDAPPLNLVTDAGLLGTSVESTLLVTRSGHTERKALEHAVAQLRRLHAPVGGIVLNDFALEERQYYGKEGRYYGSEPERA